MIADPVTGKPRELRRSDFGNMTPADIESAIRSGNWPEPAELPTEPETGHDGGGGPG